ncbi:MAG TPA: hypothetical protein VGL86_25080 [Polyangia bacterium]|jgi:hypothetical protein
MASFAAKFFAQFEGTRGPRMVALFRIAFFGGLALHFFPALIHLDDAYAAAGLRSQEWNHWLYAHFTTMPRGVVRALAIATMLGIAAAVVGFRPRAAAIVAFAGCYTFASFNALPVQTLALVNAWAILLLWSICGGGAAVFSVDAIWRKGPRVEPRLFARLALYQTLLVVFFSGVEKLLAGWPFTNEMGVILSYPRGFMVRDWVAATPSLSHPFVTQALSWLTLVVELGTPVALLFRRTRLVALVAYEAFFLGIVATLEVPPLFYFMFAAGGLLALDD